jgi:hypothetical protein
MIRRGLKEKKCEKEVNEAEGGDNVDGTTRNKLPRKRRRELRTERKELSIWSNGCAGTGTK